MRNGSGSRNFTARRWLLALAMAGAAVLLLGGALSMSETPASHAAPAATATIVAVTTPASPVTVGTPVTISVGVAGTGATAPSGTVMILWFQGSACSANAAVAQSILTLTPQAGSVSSATSTPFTPTAPGTYAYNAEYSGDATYGASTSQCGSLTVNAATAATSMTFAQSNPASPVAVGTSVAVTATITGTAGPAPSGTVMILWFQGSACSNAAAVSQSILTLTPQAGSVSSATSSAFTPTTAGAYAYNAQYSGDTTYGASSSQCGSLTVNAAAGGGPTIASITPTSGPAGTTVTLTGTNFVVGGTTVSFGATAVGANCSSSTSCTAVAPAGAGTVSVTVSTASGAVTAGAFAYTTTTITTTAPTATPTPTATSTPTPATPTGPTGPTVTYQPGWNMVAGPAGTTFSQAQNPLYTIQLGANQYQTQPNTQPVAAGSGYWAYFPSATTVTLSGTSSSTSSVFVAAGTYAFVGNSSATQALTVRGADACFFYNPTANAYTIVSTLAPGQACAAFSTDGATVTVGP